MSHLSESQLANLKKMLLERKEELGRHFSQDNDNSGLSVDSLRLSTGELSSVDNHPADVGTETFERSRDMAIDDSLSDEYSEIEAALKRMDDGTYGICVISQENIPYERLEAIPYTAYSVEHTPKRELSEDRPVEEEVMTAPPAGAGENRQEHSGRFDDAGAWESVEEFGSSNSPAMAAKREAADYEDM